MSEAINFAAAIKDHVDGGGSVEAVPAGTYPLTVTTVKLTKDGRALMPTCKVRAPHPNQGQTVWMGGLYYTDAAKGIFLDNMTGFFGGKDQRNEALSRCTSLEAVGQLLVGRDVDATLDVEEYNGTLRNKLKIGAVKLIGYNAPGQPAAPGAVPVAAPAAAVPSPAPVAAPAAPVAAPAAEAAVDPQVAALMAAGLTAEQAAAALAVAAPEAAPAAPATPAAAPAAAPAPVAAPAAAGAVDTDPGF